MWFRMSKHSQRLLYPPNMVNNVVLKVVSSQKYLGLLFDHNLLWDHHVSQVYKKMSNIICCHRNVLGSKLLKLLTEALILTILFQCGALVYILNHYKDSRRCRIGQCVFVGICTSTITSWSTTSIFSGFHWTLHTVSLLILCFMYHQFHGMRCIPLQPPILFGRHHHHNTRACSFFANLPRYHFTFSQKFSLQDLIMVELIA